MTRTEINEQLAAIRDNVAALIPQVDELTNAAPYKLASALSVVADRLQLTAEQIDNALAYPTE